MMFAVKLRCWGQPRLRWRPTALFVSARNNMQFLAALSVCFLAPPRLSSVPSSPRALVLPLGYGICGDCGGGPFRSTSNQADELPDPGSQFNTSCNRLDREGQGVVRPPCRGTRQGSACRTSTGVHAIERLRVERGRSGRLMQAIFVPRLQAVLSYFCFAETLFTNDARKHLATPATSTMKIRFSSHPVLLVCT